ncbi:MAG: TaqI-like C-terminal specificity domain-containing protein [bacterium]
MDKRKKLVKLFNDINEFINSNSLDTTPYSFLLNRFYLSVNNKRPGVSSLFGISRESFSSINRVFEDRLKRDFVTSLSLSHIISLPSQKVFEIENVKITPKSSVLLMTNTIVIPYEIEKKISLYIGYGKNVFEGSPFPNIEYYPVSKETPFSISLQSTLFDLIDNNSSKLKPFSFDFILDDALNFAFPSDDLIENISKLLKNSGEYTAVLKKNFLSSPLTKKHKKTLYSFFNANEINRFPQYLQVKFEKNIETVSAADANVVIKDHVENRTVKLEQEFLGFNNLLTFNDGIKPEQINLASKIESKALNSSGECFRFFMGMFKGGGKAPKIEPFRISSHFKPLIRSKEIEPYEAPKIRQYVLPDKEVFFQIPSFQDFETEKLILRYLSIKPVFSYDDSKLYFLNDVAAIIPKTNEIDLFFAEGYFNSKVIAYYYKTKFPHHNKFLKKNFSKIPFYICSKNIQKIISDLVKEIRDINRSILLEGENIALMSEKKKKMSSLDSFIYQLFKLTPSEIEIIENSLNS